MSTSQKLTTRSEGASRLMISLVMKKVSSSPLVGTMGSSKYSRSERARAVLDPGPGLRADRRLDRLHEELLRQDHVGRPGIAVVPELAPAQQPEALVAGDHPGLLGGQPSLLAEALEHGRSGGGLSAVGVHVLQ